MRIWIVILCTFCFSLFSSCVMGEGEDLVSKLCLASERGDTVFFERSVDSLQSVAPRHPRAYAELALVYRYRLGKEKPESMQADREAVRMCVYHRLGMLADSVEMRNRYESHRKGTFEVMQELASKEAMYAVASRMLSRMDGHLHRFIEQARVSAYQLFAELEMQFPGFLNNMERTLNGVLQSIHDAVNETLDSIYQ